MQTGFRARQGQSVKVFHWNKDFNAVTQSMTLQWDRSNLQTLDVFSGSKGRNYSREREST